MWPFFLGAEQLFDSLEGEAATCPDKDRLHTDEVRSLSPIMEEGWLCRAPIKCVGKSSQAELEEFC